LLESTEGEVKYGQSREAGKTEHERGRKTKQQHNTTQYVLDTTMANNILLDDC
jgi:hypothetical protein